MHPLIRSASATAMLLLAGCSSDQNPWRDYFQVIRQGLAGGSASSITRSQAAAIPYASLGYRIDGSKEALLVLATDTNGDQLWTASSHVVLSMRGGRIVRSVGLPHDLAATAAQAGDTLPPLSDALRGPYRSSRTVDLPDIGAYGVALNCLTSARGPQTISIIGTAIRTIRIDETCRSGRPRWTFTNNYWLDAETGFVWHSVQQIHPSGTTIQVEIFRPPG